MSLSFHRLSFAYYLSLFFLLLTLPNSLLAQKIITLSGALTLNEAKPLSLQYYATSFQNNLDQTDVTTNEKGLFKLKLSIMEEQIVNLFVGSEIIRFHVAPFDSIFMILEQKEGKISARFYGNGSPEAAWFGKQKQQFENTFESPQFPNTLLVEMGLRSPQNFKKYLDSITQEKISFLKKNSKGLRPSFVTWQSGEIIYEQESFKLNYPSWFYSMRGIENKELLVDSSYYDYLKKIQLNQEPYLSSSQYRNFLKYFFMYEIRRSKKQYTAPELLNLSATYFTGKVLQSFKLHLWSDIIQYGNISDAQAMYPIVKAELSTLEGFAYLEKQYQEKLPFAIGSKAIPFTLRSIDGKKISLSDYQGKVVYIDFWASWCGPCKREVPAGEELKKYFAGKDVVFLNVSIDEDEDKWRNAVQNLHISGMHLLANSSNNPEVLQAYKVASIPSYFLIGKDGKFLAAPAMRPSQGEIYPLIENALKAN